MTNEFAEKTNPETFCLSISINHYTSLLLNVRWSLLCHQWRYKFFIHRIKLTTNIIVSVRIKLVFTIVHFFVLLTYKGIKTESLNRRTNGVVNLNDCLTATKSLSTVGSNPSYDDYFCDLQIIVESLNVLYIT